MAIIQIDICNFQSDIKAKVLINSCFNIESHITTIYGTNMNPNISQYKNYWKQKYMSELQKLDLFYFIFGSRVSVQHNVTCYGHTITKNVVEGSERNDIIQHVIHMLILRQIYGYLEQAEYSVAWAISLEYIRQTILYKVLHQVLL